MFLEIARDTSELEDTRQCLKSALQVAWDTIDKKVFDNLEATIDHHIKTCIITNR